MARYFLDVEYNGFCGDLISLALVPEAEGAAPFYAALACPNPTPWVAAHVLPVLHVEHSARAEMAARFADYLGDDPDPVLVADWPEDIAHAAMLMVVAPGRRTALDRITFKMLDPIGFDAATLSALPHNALQDAAALRAFVLGQESR
ncbi:MAG: hypothetical protein V4472_27660 [Pseudomonadota bacterium]